MDEIVVAAISQSRGQKSDALDAFQRAEELRTHAVKTPVFKAPRLFSELRELSKGPLDARARRRASAEPTQGHVT